MGLKFVVVFCIIYIENGYSLCTKLPSLFRETRATITAQSYFIWSQAQHHFGEKKKKKNFWIFSNYAYQLLLLDFCDLICIFFSFKIRNLLFFYYGKCTVYAELKNNGSKTEI